MNKWGIGFAAVVLLCLPIWLQRARSPLLLEDTDTQGILAGVRAHENPWSWFAGDWPLQNHFYRPVSTLTFEWDDYSHGASASGMGATNALLAIFSVLALAWLLRELTDSVGCMVAGCSVLVAWLLDLGPMLATVAWSCAAIPLAAIFIKERDWKRGVASALVLGYVGFELNGATDLKSRMIEWIPGRTASTMALFMLAAIAAYARWERLTAPASVPGSATSTDRPATRSTRIRVASRGPAWVWPVVSALCLLLALGSYEQAVMGPALMVIAALTISKFGLQPRWRIPVGSIVLVAGYLAIRRIVLPSTPSPYQEQQFRFTVSALYAMMDFVAPAFNAVRFGWHAIASGWTIWLFAQPWIVVLKVASNAAALAKVRKGSPLLIFGYWASLAAFAPMAFLKPFDHYYFLPMALRTAWIVGLTILSIDLMVSAATRPARQAPPRLDPAPGSLLRP